MMRPFNQEGRFVSGTSTVGGTIRSLTVRGAGATMGAGVISVLIQLCSTVILARILMPRDFGLVTMVTTFSLLLVNFGLNGFTEAIVQRDELSHGLASNIFWINLGCGSVLTALFAALGPSLAWFYHDPPVAGVAMGISLSIFVTSLSTVHLALLKRAMLFSWVSVNDICARAISVFLSIILAWLGYGYWALVVGVVAIPASTCLGAFILCRWVPGLPRRNSGTGPTLQFALNTYGTFAVNYGARNTDNLLVGWRFDAQALGFYKKAYDLFALSANQFVASIAVVMIAGLSRAKKDAQAYRNAVTNALSVMTFVGMWMGAILTLIGKDLILIVLGPKWGPTGQIFTYFGPGIGIMMLYTTRGWIHLSAGRPDRYLRWGILEFSVTLALFLVGLHWGPSGVAAAWSASFWILTIPAIWYAGRPVELQIMSVLSAIWRFIVASLLATIPAILLLRAFPALAAKPGIFAALNRVEAISILTTMVYLAVVVLLHGGTAPIVGVFDLLLEALHLGGHRPVDAPEPAPVSALEGLPPNPDSPPDRLPLVSILIPAYNAEEWIAATLQSALAQTWPCTEIIVVDDGSKDRTLEIARQFERQGVRVIAQKNRGASAARNNAFSHSHGEYIQWLDADDLLAPDKIARQMELVLRGLSKRTLLSSPWGRFMYRHNRAQFIPTPLWCDLAPQEWLVRKMALNIYMQTATWLVSRELTEAAGPWDIRLLGDDDGEYFCRVLLASNGVRFVPGANVYYRAFRFDSLSFIGRFPNKIEAHWISMKLHIKYLRSLSDDDRARSACVQYLRTALIYFYPDWTHILQEASDLAAELGGTLGKPHLSWKYSWLEMCFGWAVVRPAQGIARKIRWGLTTKADYLLFRFQNRNGALMAKFRPASNVSSEVPSQQV